MFIGGVHWRNPSISESDILLTGVSGPGAELFFAQRFDALLFAKANWGIVGAVQQRLHLVGQHGGFGDLGDDRPARSTIDSTGRVLVGGRFKANAASNPYSATASRLTSTDAQPAAIDIFQNSFE